MTNKLLAEIDILKKKCEAYERAIEDIKTEFRQIDASHVYKYFGYDEIIGIIDKHINGKEQNG